MSTDLHRAAKGGDTDTVKKLVEKGEYDLNTGDNLGRTPFYLACVSAIAAARAARPARTAHAYSAQLCGGPGSEGEANLGRTPAFTPWNTC